MKEISGKKVVKIFFICIAVGVVLFAFLLFVTIKTKTTNISKKAPFASILNKPIVTLENIYLFEKKDPTNRNYPYIALDTGNRNWIPYNEQVEIPSYQIKRIKKIPKGATFIFDKATMYTNGVSGSSTARLFGELKSDGDSYLVEYLWGEESISRIMDGIEDSWFFHKAPWQSQRDTNYYKLPDAQWW